MNKKQRHYHFSIFDMLGGTAIQLFMASDIDALNELVDNITDDEHFIIECRDIVFHVYTPYELTTLEVLALQSTLVNVLNISLMEGHDVYIEVLPSTD